MNKYILAEMTTKKLGKEIGMVAKPLPEGLKVIEAEIPPEALPPGGKIRIEPSLYQADKIKKIAIIKNTMGEFSAGSVVLITPEDVYDLPFIIVDVSFLSLETSKIFTELDAKPLVKDEESMRKYTDPFRKWREAMGKLPSEPIIGRPEPGEFLKANFSEINYLRFIPAEYTDEVLNLTDQFLDIFISIYRSAEPVRDIQKRRQMDAFRSEFNRLYLDEDPAGVMILNTLGLEKTQLFCEHLVYL